MQWQTWTVVCSVFLIAGCVAGTEAGDLSTQAGGPDPGTLPPVEDDEARITGTVTDDALVPVAGAQVGILNLDPQVVVSTNAAGQFALVGLAPARYTIGVQQLGYQSVTRSVEAVAGQTVDMQLVLTPLPVETGESRSFTIIGEGYFACGADTPVVTWGNLHACVFDNHKPNISFDAPKASLSGIMDEIRWSQSSGLTSQSLSAWFSYGHYCTPFCGEAERWDSDDGYGDHVSSSPVRFFVPFDDKEKEKVKEDPMPLKSVTFPDRDGEPVVLVFQQRMTHYITMFWGPLEEETVLEKFTAIPDG